MMRGLLAKTWCRANTNVSVYNPVGANASVHSLVGALGVLMRTLHIICKCRACFRSGSKICSGGWHFDMLAAELATILAFVLVHCWFTRRSMGITNFGLETPKYWKTWSAIAVMALRRRNFLPLEKFG